MRLATCFGLIGLLSSACDAALPVADAGAGSDASSSQDAGSEGSEGKCAPPRSATIRVGKAGGVLSLCGASVEVPAALLSEPVGLTLRVVEVPERLPYYLEPAGLAFALEVDGTVPPSPLPPFSVLVPYAPTTRNLFFYRFAGQYQQIEACTVNQEVIGQMVGVAGTYVAMVDVEDFPSSSAGLGTGTLETSLDGQVESFDLDADEGAYAIYDEGGDGKRVYTLSVSKPLPANNLAIVRLTFSHATDGRAKLVEVTYGDLNSLWGSVPFDDGSSGLDIKSIPDAGIEGTFSVKLKLGGQTKTLTGSFAVQADKFRYPSLRSCYR